MDKVFEIREEKPRGRKRVTAAVAKSAYSEVVHDSTLSGKGVTGDPLSVIGGGGGGGSTTLRSVVKPIPVLQAGNMDTVTFDIVTSSPTVNQLLAGAIIINVFASYFPSSGASSAGQVMCHIVGGCSVDGSTGKMTVNNSGVVTVRVWNIDTNATANEQPSLTIICDEGTGSGVEPSVKSDGITIQGNGTTANKLAIKFVNSTDRSTLWVAPSSDHGVGFSSGTFNSFLDLHELEFRRYDSGFVTITQSATYNNESLTYKRTPSSSLPTYLTLDSANTMPLNLTSSSTEYVVTDHCFAPDVFKVNTSNKIGIRHLSWMDASGTDYFTWDSGTPDRSFNMEFVFTAANPATTTAGRVHIQVDQYGGGRVTTECRPPAGGSYTYRTMTGMDFDQSTSTDNVIALRDLDTASFELPSSTNGGKIKVIGGGGGGINWNTDATRYTVDSDKGLFVKYTNTTGDAAFGDHLLSISHDAPVSSNGARLYICTQRAGQTWPFVEVEHMAQGSTWRTFDDTGTPTSWPNEIYKTVVSGDGSVTVSATSGQNTITRKLKASAYPEDNEALVPSDLYPVDFYRPTQTGGHKVEISTTRWKIRDAAAGVSTTANIISGTIKVNVEYDSDHMEINDSNKIRSKPQSYTYIPDGRQEIEGTFNLNDIDVRSPSAKNNYYLGEGTAIRSNPPAVYPPWTLSNDQFISLSSNKDRASSDNTELKITIGPAVYGTNKDLMKFSVGSEYITIRWLSGSGEWALYDINTTKTTTYGGKVLTLDGTSWGSGSPASDSIAIEVRDETSGGISQIRTWFGSGVNNKKIYLLEQSWANNITNTTEWAMLLNNWQFYGGWDAPLDPVTRYSWWDSAIVQDFLVVRNGTYSDWLRDSGFTTLKVIRNGRLRIVSGSISPKARTGSGNASLNDGCELKNSYDWPQNPAVYSFTTMDMTNMTSIDVGQITISTSGVFTVTMKSTIATPLKYGDIQFCYIAQGV